MASNDLTLEKAALLRQRAVERAVRKHGRLLVNWLAQKFNDRDIAQDIAQNAYIRVLRYAETNEIDNPRALIFKTAANLASNEIRSRRRSPILATAQGASHEDLLEAVACDAPSPERVEEARQELKISMTAISQLRGPARRAFVMSRFMDKSYREIATDLHVSESSVEKYIISALKTLREAVQREEGRGKVIDITGRVALRRKKLSK